MKSLEDNIIYWILLLAIPCFGSAGSSLPSGRTPEESGPATLESLPFGIAITDFTLVDPQANEDLYILRDGGIIDKATVAALPLNIRANEIEPQAGLRVEFDLQGALNHRSVEAQSPYALFGDTRGSYNGKVFPSGNYILRAAAYSVDSEGNLTLINEISLSFVVGQETNEVIGVNLIDAEFDTDLDLPSREYHIQEGRIFDSDNYPFFINGPREISIKATTNSYATGSVHFSLSGPLNYTRTENAEPFTLFGDQAADYTGRILPLGRYVLTLTPYAGKNRQGIRGPVKTLSFTIADLPEISIQEFAGFIDAAADQEATYLSPYMANIIDQAEIPTDFVNLAVYPSFPGEGLGSVFLQLTGPVSHSRTENLAPYALFGDDNFNYAGKSLPAGNYVLQATPYTGPNRSGLAGLGYTYIFEIRSSVTSLAKDEEEDSIALVIWPNPARAVPEIWIRNLSDTYEAELYTLDGELIKKFPVPGKAESNLQISDYRKGLYFLRFSGKKSRFSKILAIE